MWPCGNLMNYDIDLVQSKILRFEILNSPTTVIYWLPVNLAASNVPQELKGENECLLVITKLWKLASMCPFRGRM